MDFLTLDKFTKGWIIGDFDPSIIRTKDFEFSVKKYEAGFTDRPHTHKIAEEITVIISGKFQFNDQIVGEGDIVVIHPNEAPTFTCLEDGYNAVIKIPSVVGDKYFV